MNHYLDFIPERPQKPRDKGLTMVMDKGLSVRQAENLMSSSSHLVDFVKLGFGTSLITQGLKEKIEVYHQANVKVFLGGTLFEAFLVRDAVDEYKKLVASLQLKAVEISDGSILLPHDQKCAWISEFAKDYTVLSEVGHKMAGADISHNEWIAMMQKELKAGSFKVIAEARESGTIGIFGKDGKADAVLIKEISQAVSLDNVLWEAPLKSQQAWFVQEFGANVNLGNIAYNEVIALETLRLGLRGDTFFRFLPENLQQFRLI